MRDETKGDDTRITKIGSDRDSLGDLLKLGWGKRPRGQHLAERMLFEANGRCRPDGRRNLRPGAEDKRCRNTDEQRERNDAGVDENASPAAWLLRCGFHETCRTPNIPKPSDHGAVRSSAWSGVAAIAEKVCAISNRGDRGESGRKEKSRVTETMEGSRTHDAADEKAGDDEKTEPQPT